MDKKKHINILIDRVSLCYYKIEKAVFYFTDLFKIILYDAIYIISIVRNITNDKKINKKIFENSIDFVNVRCYNLSTRRR